MEINRQHIKLGTGTLLFVLLLTFVIQNMAIVELQFLVWSVGVRRSLMVLGVLAIGILIGWLGCSYSRARADSGHREVR